MADIGVGIVGLGRIGWLHAEHLMGMVRGARLVAAAVDAEHRERLLATNTAPCRLAHDIEDLIFQSKVDAIVIASPSNLHYEHIVQVAEAGKPIFCEKPLADSVERALAAVSVVERNSVPFQIGFQRRFDPAYARAQALIAEGAIGEVEMFRGITCDSIPPVEYLRTSGGLFWDLGIHDFDAARFLMADDIVAVQATGAILVEPELAAFDDVDHGIVTLWFRRGSVGVVQSAWRAPYGYDIRAEVHGTKGKVIAELDEAVPARLYTAEGAVVSRHREFVERFREAYRRELQAFIDSLHADAAPTPTAGDGISAIQVADAATRSRRSGEWVAIDA